MTFGLLGLILFILIVIQYLKTRKTAIHHRGYSFKIKTIDDSYHQIILSTKNNSSKLKSETNRENQSRITMDVLLGSRTSNTNILKHITKVEPRGRRIYYETLELPTGESLDTILDLLSDVADIYPDALVLGGEAIDKFMVALADKEILIPLHRQLIKDIASDTANLYKDKATDLLCPFCIIHYAAHQIRISHLQTITYYGCRNCSQSLEFLQGYKVIAVLDNDNKIEQWEENKTLRVNWSIRRSLFDFSSVEIIQATDEDVERFAVQIGNDTDRFRVLRYGDVNCTVNSNCKLSDSAIRILDRTFGLVEVEQTKNVLLE